MCIRDSTDTVEPTLGFDIKTLEHRGFNLNFWDVGGQQTIRAYWRNYFEVTDGLIWVVDSADKWRLDTCRDELAALVVDEQLGGASASPAPRSLATARDRPPRARRRPPQAERTDELLISRQSRAMALKNLLLVAAAMPTAGLRIVPRRVVRLLRRDRAPEAPDALAAPEALPAGLLVSYGGAAATAARGCTRP